MGREFCKKKACPSSNQLLDFQRGHLEKQLEEIIKQHLLDCDFCASEVDFYSNFKKIEPPKRNIAEIPSDFLNFIKPLLFRQLGSFALEATKP